MLALLVVAAAATAGARPGERARIAKAEAQAQQLSARARRALLDLYALDSRLARARSRVASLEARADRLETAEALLARRLAATRRTLVVSRRALALHLRTLYEQGGADPLAVVFGASSLDDAVTRLDSLSRAADERRRIATVTAGAQRRLVRLRIELGHRRQAVAASLAAARQSETALAVARTERASYLSSLRSRARVKAAQLVVLRATATRVERRSAQLQAGAVRASPPAATPVAPVPASVLDLGTPARPSEEPGPASAGATITVTATGYSLAGHTATGMPVGWGVVAVDPSVVPLGTRLTIPGYGEGVAADVGGGIRGETIDLWFPTQARARAWGRRTVTITLH